MGKIVEVVVEWHISESILPTLFPNVKVVGHMRASTVWRDDGGAKMYLYIYSLRFCLLRSSFDLLLLMRFQPVLRAAKQTWLVYSVHVIL